MKFIIHKHPGKGIDSKTFCGIRIYSMNYFNDRVSFRWNRVTCKNCLRQKNPVIRKKWTEKENIRRANARRKLHRIQKLRVELDRLIG